jgi:hypothetical protein
MDAGRMGKLSIRLCIKCKEQCEKMDGLLAKVLKLAKKGAWMCPFGKIECGKEILDNHPDSVRRLFS